MTLRTTITILGIASLLLWSTHAFSKEDIRVMGHRVPPFSMHDSHGSVSGFSAELFQVVYRKIHGMKAEAHIMPVTFNRLYADLQRAPRRIGITVGRNEKREKLFKWVGPYLKVHIGVIAKKDNMLRITSPKDLHTHKIGTVENTFPEQALLKMGIPRSNLVSDIYPLRNIHKLHNNHIPLMAYPVQAASYLMKKNGFSAKDFEEVYSLKEAELYFAFSKDFSDEEIQRYQKNLDTVLATHAYQALKLKYSLDDIARQIRQH